MKNNKFDSSTTGFKIKRIGLNLRKNTVLSFFLLATCLNPSWADSVTYSYDALGRVIQANYSTGVVIVYVYDAAGNRNSYIISDAPS